MDTVWKNSLSTDANSFPSGQETPCVSWNQTAYCNRHNSPLMVHNASHINPVHTLPPHFLKIHINVILSSTTWSSKCPASFFHNISTQYILQWNVNYCLLQWINWLWSFVHTAVTVMATVLCNMTVRSNTKLHSTHQTSQPRNWTQGV